MTATLSPPTAQGMLPSPLLHEVRQLLETDPPLLRVPASLRADFRRYRHRDLGTYLLLSTPALLLFYLSTVGVATLLFARHASAADQQLWWAGCLFTGTVLFVGMAPMLVERMRAIYTPVVAVMATLILTKLAVMPSLLANPALVACESFTCLTSLILVVLASRLSIGVSALVCLCSALLITVMLLVVFQVTPDWMMLKYYFGTPVLVCLYVGWLQERQERVNFLQSRLLVHDAHERDLMNRELNRMAHHDALSGLANRRRFDTVLAMEWERLRREQRPLAVLFIDVDYFKRYNDHYGHAPGDDCLAAVGQAIGSCVLRPGDLAARYGGEEFVVLLPDTEVEGAKEVGERIIAAVDALAIPHAGSLVSEHVTLSCGLAVRSPSTGGTSADLLKAADTALYDAKQAGRHRLCVEALDEPQPHKQARV
ncbi:MAG: diguanylate cyclase [Moraxellaceae bacterium]|nr:diguanylate cyclase [Moraxellaceae bacterium]